MKTTALILTASLAMSGCVTFQESLKQAERQQQVSLNHKAEVLTRGTPEAEVREVWGTPYTTNTYAGEHSIRMLQYGQCAFARSVTTGVIFITIVNGAVYSWSSRQC